MNLKTNRYELFEQNETLHTLVVYKRKDFVTANRSFKHYPEDSKFNDGDTPQFRNLSVAQVVGLFQLLGIPTPAAIKQ